jgi:plastocyanin
MMIAPYRIKLMIAEPGLTAARSAELFAHPTQRSPALRAAAKLVLVFVMFLAMGCDHSSDVVAPRPTVPAGTGVVRGVVRFLGKVPAIRQIGGDCCPGSTPVMDESLLVNPDGSLRNVVVYIKDGPNVATSLQDMVLTQKNCQYVPHVLGIQTGQNLVVTSHDATLHNVHIIGDVNPSQNFSEAQNASHAVRFDHPELVRFKCDVHPWMTAYAYVFDHPCFAVSDENGRFEIKNLPPGKYTLVAWQEKLLAQEMQVTVSGDKPSEVTVEYREH